MYFLRVLNQVLTICGQKIYRSRQSLRAEEFNNNIKVTFLSKGRVYE